MIARLSDTHSTFTGFAKLARLAAEGRDLLFDRFELDLSALSWLDGNMCAPLGAVLANIADSLSTVSVVGAPQPVENILRKNGFLVAHGYQPLPRNATALPYRRFKLQDTALFAKYLRDHLPGKGIPTMSEGLGRYFQQSLFEIFENCAFHSGSSLGVFVCGQFFPMKRRVDIAIADAGITIPKKVNDRLGVSLKPEDALAWALAKGNTTKTDRPGGVGLKFLKDFITLNSGRLQIASGLAYWELSGGKESFQRLPHPLPGTAVNLEVNTADDRSYKLANEVSPENVF